MRAEARRPEIDEMLTIEPGAALFEMGQRRRGSPVPSPMQIDIDAALSSRSSWLVPKPEALQTSASMPPRARPQPRYSRQSRSRRRHRRPATCALTPQRGDLVAHRCEAPRHCGRRSTRTPPPRHATAIARPMPRLPPVTTARFPERSDYHVLPVIAAFRCAIMASNIVVSQPQGEGEKKNTDRLRLSRRVNVARLHLGRQCWL